MHVADLTTAQWFVAAWIAVGAAYAVARSIQMSRKSAKTGKSFWSSPRRP